MKRSFNVTVAQAASTPGDIENNFETAKNWIQKNKSADLIVFAQSFLTGGGAFDMPKKYPVLIKKSKEYLKKLAPHTKGTNVLMGSANEIVFLHDGKIEKTLHDFGTIKIHDKNIAVFEGKNFEKEGFLGGSGKIDCAVVCYSTTTRVGQECRKNKMFSGFARKINTPVIFVNTTGAIDCITYEGASRLYGRDGKLLCCAKFLEEDAFKIDLNNLKNCTIDPLINDFQYCPDEFSLDYSKDLKRTYLVTIKSIREYFYKNGFSKAVLGLSGGIDSSVCAVLLKDALGAQNVLGVSMPSRISSAHSKIEAQKLAQNLDIKYIEIPIADMVNTVYDGIKKGEAETDFKKYEKSYTLDNIQARTRATILWGLANEFEGMLPVATCDKSESYVGYATINGDMSGSFSPIGDITKTKTYALAKFINAEKEIIPNEIIKRRPTAELEFDDKTGRFLMAEEALMPYEFLDEVIWYFENRNLHIDEMMQKEFLYKTNKAQKEEWIRKFFARMQGALYKWTLEPPCPITDRCSLADCAHPVSVKIPR